MDSKSDNNGKHISKNHKQFFMPEMQPVSSRPQMNVEAETFAETATKAQVAFGTSGLRAMAKRITDQVAYQLNEAFLMHIGADPGTEVAVAGDLRLSTSRIASASCEGISAMGCKPVYCGPLPSPAVAYFAMKRGIPSLMVTASHNPAIQVKMPDGQIVQEEQNGAKHTTPTGEIKKQDEPGIKAQRPPVPAGLFNDDGSFRESHQLPPVDPVARQEYIERYTRAFPRDLLKGKRVGVYQHCAVGRDIMVEIYQALGATVVPFARTDQFVAVDTEAVRPEDLALAREWAAKEKLDFVVSADADSDRPLTFDEKGKLIRGDVTGILTARFFGADGVVVPNSCNHALEMCPEFAERTLRSRIGSPFVIEGMESLSRIDRKVVVGYEGNGGFLLGSDVNIKECLLRLAGDDRNLQALARQAGDEPLTALPTRDAVIVHLALMSLSVFTKKPLSEVVAGLPPRYTESGRIPGFPRAAANGIIADMMADHNHQYYSEILEVVSGGSTVQNYNTIDGLCLEMTNGEIVYLRASGNADDFRAYAEADTEERAAYLRAEMLKRMMLWMPKV